MLQVNATDLNRFMACNASRLMPGEPLPGIIQDTTSRDEGSAAHHMAMAVINGTAIETLVDRKAPNGVYMTDEMVEHVETFINAINRVYYAPVQTEIDVSFNSDTWNIAARADFIGLADKTLHVDDFKYGWRIVEIENNWTLLAYAIGWCRKNSIQPERIIMTVHQPRPYHRDGPSRSWEISYAELMTFAMQLTAALTNPSDFLQTSAHCAKCPALTTCPAARNASMNAVDVSEMAYSDEVDNVLLSFNLDTLYRAQSLIKARLDALEELAQHRIKAGQVIENYSVEHGYGHYKWNEGITADILKAVTGKEMTKSKTLTPAEAKKIVDEKIVKSLSHRPTTSVKLVRGSHHKRATKIFNN